MSDLRVRFAPSPTGYLHIGGARTALFNYLLAKKEQGTFVLRIEDTDVERSTQESVDAILQAMDWLGLSYDEGPFYQSERYDLYKGKVQELLDKGLAYRCYCTPEELDAKRVRQRRRPAANHAMMVPAAIAPTSLICLMLSVLKLPRRAALHLSTRSRGPFPLIMQSSMT